MNASYSVKVTRHYVQTTDKEKRRVTIPVTIRRLFLHGNFVQTQQFRCIRVKRNGTVSYSVCYIPEQKKSMWTELVLRVEEQEQTWKKYATMNEKDFRDWISKILGTEKAALAFNAML